jgi:peptidoglycan glycosyltransferase
VNRELKRVSIVVLLMFLSLFASTTAIQAIASDSLKADGRNARTIYASFSAERGPILVDGTPIAQSVPSDDEYKFQRAYPGGPMYAPITGYLTLFGAPTGIEGAMNGELSGTANQQFLDQLNQIITGQSPKGAAVELTIDPVAQQVAWDQLAGAGLTGAVIALDPKTGAILAMVSNPTFDPNPLASHDTGAVDALYQSLLDDPGDPLINRTIQGDLDPPGSTFKLVTGSTAFENGISPDTLFPNPPSLQLPQSDSLIFNSDGGACGGGGEVSVADAIRLSCNIPMALLGQQLGWRAIFDQAEKFGFGTSFDIPMSTEASIYPRALDEPQTMLSAFGQSGVRASPLQMAMISAAIANGGQVMVPNMVESVTSPELRVLESFSPQVWGQAISPQTAATLTQIMVGAVSNGSGTNAIIDGIDVAGKTGTAENGDGEPFSLWFTGFAPANDPRVAVAVVVQNGGGLDQSGTGNELAAPIARAVMEAVLFG